MSTRIYQGRILSAQYDSSSNDSFDTPAIDALLETFNLFQDAVNYHLVALAGMASPTVESYAAQFRKQIEMIWTRHPRNNTQSQTLQQSVTNTLNIPSDSSFEEAINEIFRNTEHQELLPYVLHYITERTSAGDGAIQQGGRSILPKLCDSTFKGNYDYSAKEKKATNGKLRLQQELNREGISEEELIELSKEMDLSWAGIKTKPNADHTGSILYSEADTYQQVEKTMLELCDTIKNSSDSVWVKHANEHKIDLLADVRKALQHPLQISADHLLAKNNKVVPSLKQAAVFFMFYPCQISATLLKLKLGKEKKKKNETEVYDCSTLENDPVLLCRGKRGYIYKGYTALAEWEQNGSKMYSAEWDILAFKEALKTLHSFELKTEERRKHVEELKNKLRYIEEGVGKITGEDDENDTPLPVLGGDPRFELLKQLVEEIAPGDYDNYTISRRALQNYEDVLQRWQEAEKQGACNEDTLISIVRNEQGTSERFGSGVLFEALCRKKYQPIWHDWQDNSKSPKPRSQNILKDFNIWQDIKQEIEQYERPVNITAADAIESPRQLFFSDLENFGPKSKGHEFVKGQKNTIRLRVAVRNTAGHLEGATIIVRYSAPRFDRDELGTDAACWLPDKKADNTVTSWLQPMMKALNLDSAKLHMSNPPAVALQIKGQKHAQRICYLNFPVSFDFATIHARIGKADVWNNQILGGKDEKLHLHWPGTYAAAQSPWWSSQKLKETGFTALSVDLGVRYAAAWALMNVQTHPEIRTEKGTVIKGRTIGNDGKNSWYGFCTKNGLLKIDGEGNGQKSDSSGRPLPDGVGQPTPQDKALATYLFELANIEARSITNVLELCNQANKAFRKLLSRCRKYQSMLVKLNKSEQHNDVLKEAHEYFTYNEVTKQYIDGIIQSIQKQDERRVRELLLEALTQLRKKLPEAAEKLANLLLPRKNGEWIWVPDSKPGYICSGRLIQGTSKNPKRKVFHRGGLSIARLSQIEELRRNLQSLNRILYTAPGEQADFGSELRNVPVEDPCPDILRKIENIREQRVNKIAHEIVAMALGVRLLPPRKNKNTDNRDIVHGEYERIPNRQPVDFVILENLSRYLTSIDRTTEENSTLMRWAHRQIVAKVKQLLEEVFGIPVICTHAAYTSKFDAWTSAPGFRTVEMTEQRLKNLSKSEKENDQRLSTIYSALYKQAKDLRDGLKLLMPNKRNGGEFFLYKSADGIHMRNADINAAINIGWRGLAAPEALHLLHRVRLNKKKGEIKPVYSNKREKALERNWNFKLIADTAQSSDLASSFWIDAESDIPPMAQYCAPLAESTCQLAHGKTLWSRVKEQRWALCHSFNIRVLQKVGIDTTVLQRYLDKCKLLTEDDSDITR